MPVCNLRRDLGTVGSYAAGKGGRSPARIRRVARRCRAKIHRRLLKIYNGIKPLLTVISALPLIPSGWRAALVLFNNALAAVAAGVGADDVTADFKAGRICEARHADPQDRS